MSKAQARKRISEARAKILAVVTKCGHTSGPDDKKLYDMWSKLQAIEYRLKK